MDRTKKNIFLKVSIFEILDSALQDNKIKREFHYIRVNQEIRWVIENDNSTINVLKKWRPYNYLNFLSLKALNSCIYQMSLQKNYC